jgi:hypothetical protein
VSEEAEKPENDLIKENERPESEAAPDFKKTFP